MGLTYQAHANKPDWSVFETQTDTQQEALQVCTGTQVDILVM